MQSHFSLGGPCEHGTLGVNIGFEWDASLIFLMTQPSYSSGKKSLRDMELKLHFGCCLQNSVYINFQLNRVKIYIYGVYPSKDEGVQPH